VGQPTSALGSVRDNTTTTNIMRGMGYELEKGFDMCMQGIPESVEVIVWPKNPDLDSIKKPKPVVTAKQNPATLVFNVR
jgi:hypothetical protein